MNINQLNGFTTPEDDNDFIPIISLGEEDPRQKDEKLPDDLPILPIRNTVLFPGVVVPITVGRDKSIKLIKDAHKGSRIIGVVTQKDVTVEDPSQQDLHTYGTIARIVKMLRMPDGNTTVIIQGRYRFKIEEIVHHHPYLRAKVANADEVVPSKRDKEFSALIATMKDLAIQMIQMSPNLPSEAAIAIRNIESPNFLINFIASNLQIDVNDKQRLLEIDDLKSRAHEVSELLNKEFQMLELKNQINNKVRTDLDKQQREYFLHQQLKTIQEELGGNTPDLEIQNMRERGKHKKWPAEVAEAFFKELDRMQRMNSMSPDYSVLMNYVELLLEIPWQEFTKDKFDLKKAKKILDNDHFGLEKVKDRILEYLAVLKLKADMKAPILCFVGPPGVGKTSLGKSIAKALGRKYVRMSLGGVHDEATIRGHRRTYIGAMPGRIIQSIKKAKTANPVMVLDEIDKVGQDFRGDISSALLEVLDPEQNKTFFDHYLELDFDLSKVLFIATANTLSTIQPALLDRMEIIEINGYTMEEKLQIARKYLFPKQLSEHGLEPKETKINNTELEHIIEGYTRESGVRTLDKRLATVVRNVAKIKAMDEQVPELITKTNIRTALGAPFYEQDKYEGNQYAGVVTGLAWTPVGGDILLIETAISRGNGKITLTGNLGDVMKESATIAMGYIKAHTDALNIDPKVFQNIDFHIHVPEGATPKDGPSAGITMLTSMVSAIKQVKVLPHLAMTGEITLRGKVLPVGGIKEKILAAKRSGIKHIIMCSKNRKDVEEINADYVKNLHFHFVEDAMEVLNLALLSEKVKHPLDIDKWLTAL